MLVDTHRHFGGCIPIAFVWETIQKLQLYHLAESEQDVRNQMSFTYADSRTFHHFLRKFDILDRITWTAALIDQSIKLVSDNLEAEGIDYAWIDFSTNKYVKHLKCDRTTAVKLIYDSFQRYRPDKVGLILSIKHEAAEYAEEYTEAMFDYLVGVDIVGDEGQFNPTKLAPALKPWSDAQKMVRTHVGEFGSEENIHAAIYKLGVTNIAHGIKIKHPDLIKAALDHGICFDLGLSSNYYTGIYTGQHPLRSMIDAGLMVTLGTDDPVICDTTLAKEFELAQKHGLTKTECLNLQNNAVELYKRFRK